MNDPDLIYAIRDLHMAITTLTDELRQHRQAEQAGIEEIVELHQRKCITMDTESQSG